jgi:hypothetical protein
MTMRRLGVLLIWLAVTGLIGGVGGLRAYAADSGDTTPVAPHTYSQDGIYLTNRAGCPSRQLAIASLTLCKVPSHSIDKETFRSIRDRLSAGANGTEALCEIDGAVVQAQQDCLSSQYLGDVELIAGLMHVLAHN